MLAGPDARECFTFPDCILSLRQRKRAGRKGDCKQPVTVQLLKNSAKFDVGRISGDDRGKTSIEHSKHLTGGRHKLGLVKTGIDSITPDEGLVLAKQDLHWL